jgi:hypothetical protein
MAIPAHWSRHPGAGNRGDFLLLAYVCLNVEIKALPGGQGKYRIPIIPFLLFDRL